MALIAYLTLLGGFVYVAVVPVVLIDLLVRYIRRRDAGRALLIVLTSVAGFIGGGFAAWMVLARGWALSFATTVQASVDAETWGHPIEHHAENLLLAVLFFSLFGAAVAAGSGAGLTRARAH